MRIDFLGLHAFVAIAERGSFQLAAAHLNLSQTALSHRIRKLEEELGVSLVERAPRTEGRPIQNTGTPRDFSTAIVSSMRLV